MVWNYLKAWGNGERFEGWGGMERFMVSAKNEMQRNVETKHLNRLNGLK